MKILKYEDLQKIGSWLDMFNGELTTDQEFENVEARTAYNKKLNIVIPIFNRMRFLLESDLSVEEGYDMVNDREDAEKRTFNKSEVYRWFKEEWGYDQGHDMDIVEFQSKEM